MMFAELATKQKNRVRKSNSSRAARVERASLQEIQITDGRQSEPSDDLQELEIAEFSRIIADILQRRLTEAKNCGDRYLGFARFDGAPGIKSLSTSSLRKRRTPPSPNV
jgi:hypothetical protein